MSVSFQIPFTGLQKQYSTLREEILDATDQVLQSGQLMSGCHTKRFEEWLAKKNHTRHAVTCHSGTQALEILALFYRLQNVRKGKTAIVLIPALTYVATANAWRKAGWDIHIVDTDYRGLLDFKKIPSDLEWNAICPVGLYGSALAFDFMSLDRQLCVEDAAQHWLSNNCFRYGSAAISFDPTKNLGNYGNGGAIVTDNFGLAQFARDWGRNRSTSTVQTQMFDDSLYSSCSTNSRMSEVDCAQLMVKTQYLDTWQQRRRDIVAYWISRFVDSPVRALIDDTNFSKHCFHKFVIDANNRDTVQGRLAQAGIETKVHYKDPIQDLPEYQNCNGPNMVSASAALSRRCLTLPLYPELKDSEVEYIATQVLNCV